MATVFWRLRTRATPIAGGEIGRPGSGGRTALSAMVLTITWGVRALEVTQMDPSKTTYEHLNVSESFLRRQVNGRSGSVEVDGGDVRVVTEGPTRTREHHQVVDQDHWVYRMDWSTDGGRSWDEGQIEMTFRRSE